ncbi:GNAT family N-acetyltransferase [Actinomycetospora straminea]|uniref:BioF2-like acetyltransferase domain-containing protein n=1 Tax=Actinomycetospora straminea TaxID=663607 RepID=A0ABP9DZ78_9PSEU|nr:GNAT family N-acetyltransferase [Actinomycetospora straminea]MDD7931048.1 GNAT family N-acetyltransferase [Actinomycetospora straminea]
MSVEQITSSRVRTVDPRTDRAWHELARSAEGNLFTSPPWIGAVCDTYGFTPQARVGRDTAGRPGGFAWVVVDDLRGRRITSLPFSDRSDPIAGDPDLWHALSDGVVGTDLPTTIRALAPSPVAGDARLEPVGEAAWHATSIDRTAEDMFGQVNRHARRNVAIARRRQVRVEADTTLDGVRAFHALHVRLRRQKYRLLAQPREFFDAVWARFAPSGDITTLLARHEGRLIAGALMLRWNDVLYYKFGASDPEHLSARPNDAVFWAAIEQAVSEGAGLIDWGLSDLDQPGLVAYKDKWASQQRRIVTYHSRGGRGAATSEVDTLLRRLTDLLTGDDVPMDLSRRAGDLLYRYFC